MAIVKPRTKIAKELIHATVTPHPEQVDTLR
jgi:hypothetical protein